MRHLDMRSCGAFRSAQCTLPANEAPEACADAEGELHGNVEQSADDEDGQADPEDGQPDCHRRYPGFRQAVAGDGLDDGAGHGDSFSAFTNWERKALRIGE